MKKKYLENIKKIFLQYKTLAEKAMEQISEEKLFWQYNSDSNSIELIVKHLTGNMLSRWTDFLTSDGEKECRNRDTEFESSAKTRADVMKIWEKGWTCLFHTLNQLKENDLEKIVFIRNEKHTVLDAINRQLAHYSYHIGQLVFLSKMLSEKDWKSLSIPKNKSQEFNQEKFSKK
ncbi:MAG TPA: DUF1572 family protein [Bacteroidia bacterium]|nr:DUF1572 family protein [Bacteroidia bacterium]